MAAVRERRPHIDAAHDGGSNAARPAAAEDPSNRQTRSSQPLAQVCTAEVPKPKKQCKDLVRARQIATLAQRPTSCRSKARRFPGRSIPCAKPPTQRLATARSYERQKLCTDRGERPRRGTEYRQPLIELRKRFEETLKSIWTVAGKQQLSSGAEIASDELILMPVAARQYGCWA